MEIAKVCKIGGSQAILLPKAFQVDCDEVYLKRTANGFLVTVRDPWDIFRDGVEALSEDFMARGRQQPVAFEDV